MLEVAHYVRRVMTKPELDRLTTEGRNPRTEELDCMSTLELLRVMNEEDQTVPQAVARRLPQIARAVDAIAARMAHGGRLVYVGAGTSGRLGILDAVECVPTFSAAEGQVVGRIAGGERAMLRAVEGAEDSLEQGARDLQSLGLTADDAVVGIATSGRTPYVVGALRYAGDLGALTVGLACNNGTEVAAAAAIAVEIVVGPEVLSGSTRLKAGTATKLVLNMLSTGAFVRLHKVYGNQMVDLQATSEKLVMRSRSIVAQVTGLGIEAAEKELARCGGEVKTAIIAVLRRLQPEAARDLLRRHGGAIRAALEDGA